MIVLQFVERTAGGRATSSASPATYARPPRSERERGYVEHCLGGRDREAATELSVHSQLAILVEVRAIEIGAEAQEGVEQLDWFYDEETFSTCSLWDLKRRARDGMLLVDVAGGSWRIVRVIDIGPRGKSWKRILRIIFRGDRRVRYDLVEEDPLDFDAVLDRVCRSIQANPDHWRDDEAVAGEDGPLRDEQEMLDEQIERVRSATNLRGVIDALQYNLMN